MGFDPSAHGWKLLPSGGGFSELTGDMWSKRDGDYWRYGLIAGPQHLNRMGNVHGGMLMTFVDNAIGMAAWQAAGRRPCVTMQLDTQFLAPGLPGDFLECLAKPTRVARSVVFMHAMINAGERDVLSASGIWKVVPQK